MKKNTVWFTELELYLFVFVNHLVPIKIKRQRDAAINPKSHWPLRRHPYISKLAIHVPKEKDIPLQSHDRDR